MRSNFMMATALAFLEQAGSKGMTLGELVYHTKIGEEIEAGLNELVEEDLVRINKKGRYRLNKRLIKKLDRDRRNLVSIPGLFSD